MRRIIVFSGTTEGRNLSELLTERRIEHTVCVATQYGMDVMKESPYCRVRVGRMDRTQMEVFFGQMPSENLLVVDATHPYAGEVTQNLVQAAGACGALYLRVLREEESTGESPKEGADKGSPGWETEGSNAKEQDNRGSDAKGQSDEDGQAGGEGCSITRYGDISLCGMALENRKGNILLTTGSKELGSFLKDASDSLKERTFVRVLPTAESLRLCEAAGVLPDRIIAMQGPFGQQLNEALMQQYAIRHLVTKSSGRTGGFSEKLKAAGALGVSVHVIERPCREEGMDVSKALAYIVEQTEQRTEQKTERRAEPLQITLAGMGMGSPGSMTVEVERAIREADLIFGAKRLLENLPYSHKRAMYRAEEILPVLEAEKPQRAVILFSGDSGFFSGAKGMKEALLAQRNDISIRILPGISSFSYLAAKAGESYEDAVLFSLHKKADAADFQRLTELVRCSEKVFALLAGPEDVAKIAGLLQREKIPARLLVGCNLSYETESVALLSLKEAQAFRAEGIASVLILNTHPEKPQLYPVKKDEDFLRDRVPMTKECIRHESILRLGLRKGDVLYDIGGGTGSVAIEAASLDPSLRVVTIERKKEAAELIRKNMERFCLSNLTLIEKEAEKVLSDLEAPDCVFIGGSGGKLFEILSMLQKKKKGIRCVVNAVSLESVERIRSCIDSLSLTQTTAIMLSVTQACEKGGYHMLSAQNPVWIFSFVL